MNFNNWSLLLVAGVLCSLLLLVHCEVGELKRHFEHINRALAHSEKLPLLKRIAHSRHSNQSRVHSMTRKDDGHSRFHSLLIPKLTRKHNPKNAWNGQLRQDALIAYILGCKRNGYFVDLAANHPVIFSNTYALEQFFNWTGICWEANPKYWYMLLAHRNCKVIGGAAAGRSGEELSFAYAGLVGGLYSTKRYPTDVNSTSLARAFEDSKKWKVDVQMEEKAAVPTATLNDVADLFLPYEIDYLSLDVEGAEWIVMEKFDFSRHKFSLMTIERPKKELVALLQNNGYIKHPSNIGSFGETLWLSKTLPGLQSVLSTPMEELRAKSIQVSPQTCSSNRIER